MAQTLMTISGSAVEKARRRRSDRILAPLHIHVTGKDPSGMPFEEDALTVIINQHGAAISLAHILYPEQGLRIRNLENGIEADFRVVGELRRVLGDRREWGVEVLDADSGIWGVDFGQPPEASQPKALISCAECKTASLTIISSDEYQVLLHTGLMSHHCERCGQTTRWKASEQAAAAGEFVAGTNPAPEVIERRKHPRRRLTMLLPVRSQDGSVVTVQTVDASKGGICFLSASTFHVGEVVWLMLPFTTGAGPVETKGRIVRCQAGPRGQLFAVDFSVAEPAEAARPERKRSRFWTSLTGRASSFRQRLVRAVSSND